MNKNDFEIQRLSIEGQNLERKFAFAGVLVRYGVFAFLGFWLFDTIRALGTMQPAALAGLASVVEKMNFGTLVHSIATAVLGGGWYLERKGKHRAIRKVGEFRGMVEQHDAYRSSSQLDAHGQTPSKHQGG